MGFFAPAFSGGSILCTPTIPTPLDPRLYRQHILFCWPGIGASYSGGLCYLFYWCMSFFLLRLELVYLYSIVYPATSLSSLSVLAFQHQHYGGTRLSI